MIGGTPQAMMNYLTISGYIINKRLRIPNTLSKKGSNPYVYMCVYVFGGAAAGKI